MPLSPSEQIQLSTILAASILLFIVAYGLPKKYSITVLMVLAPFQLIETRFGSSSVVLAFVVFIVTLLKNEKVELPMLGKFLLFVFWCFVSIGLMEPSTYLQHGAYVFSLISAFLVFWLCYDLMMGSDNPSGVINVFLVMNLLVAAYCVFQLWLGPGERFVLFGISELSLTRVRGDGRLTGPFESAEITAQYLVLMEFIILHQYWHSRSILFKRALIGLMALNIGFLVATGSRGEFLLLIGGAAIYLWLFHRRLGTMRAIRLAVIGSIVLAGSALIVVNFTDFGSLFDRLVATEFNEQGIPDTRQPLWRDAWQEIVKSPIVGHGPRLRFHLEGQGLIYDNHVTIRYPHNQYLFLLFTLGVPGLILYLLILFTILSRCVRSISSKYDSSYFHDLARTAALVLLLFTIDGLKIDQMRFAFSDYWHFAFGLFGVFLAACNRSRYETVHGEKQKAESAAVNSKMRRGRISVDTMSAH